MSQLHAPVAEIFSSLAGEATYVGYRQLFVRFAGCPLHCIYCDTITDVEAPTRLEQTPGQGDFAERDNPLSLELVAETISRLEKAVPGHRHLVLTGGEPLLRFAFIAQLLPLLESLKLPVYLETSGVMCEELIPLLPLLDVVAADIKLPSTTGQDYWGESRRFLQLCADAPVELLIKLPVGKLTEAEELLRAVAMAVEVAPDAPLILQPIHATDGAPELDGRDLLDTLLLVSRHHPDVRLIPQTHKLIGVL